MRNLFRHLFNRPHNKENITFQEETQKEGAKEFASILTSISQTIQETPELSRLYKAIHDILKDIVDTPNFFIAIVDEVDDALFFPYYLDEQDDMWEIHNISDPETRCLSLEVIRTGEPLFIKKEAIIAKGLGTVGPTPEVWIGIPLKVKATVIGVMAIQHYSNPDHFTQKDMDLLTLVSEQIAMTIERRMYANKAKPNAPHYPSLHSGSGDENR